MRTKPLVTDEEFLAGLDDLLDRAAVADARARCGDGDRKGTGRALKRLARSARTYARLVRSKRGRAALPDVTMRDGLVADARRLSALAKALRHTLDC
jgi:hypothetical protein